MNFSHMSNICFHREIFCNFDGMQIVWVILHHEYRCLQCWKQKNHQITECSSLSSVCIFEDWSLNLSHFDHPLFALSEHQFVIEDDEAESESELSLGSRSFLHRGGSHRSIIHQFIRFSNLDKTKFYQHSILSSLMSVRKQRVGALLLSKQRVSPF